MNYYLIIDNYNKEIKKISLARFLKESLDLDYSEAKVDTDKIIEGKPVAYKFSSQKALTEFREAIKLYGILPNEIIISSKESKIKKSAAHKKLTLKKSRFSS